MIFSKEYGYLFSVEDIADILNGKALGPYVQSNPPSKEIPTKHVRNKLREIETETLSINDKNLLKLFPPAGEKVTQKIQINSRGRSNKFYSTYYSDACLTIFGHNKENLEFNNKIQKHRFSKEDFDKLFKNKLTKNIYEIISVDFFYKELIKSLYKQQQQLITDTVRAKQHYKENYVKPLQDAMHNLHKKNIFLNHQVSEIDKKNELLKNMLNKHLDTNDKLKIFEFSLFHDSEALKKYILKISQK